MNSKFTLNFCEAKLDEEQLLTLTYEIEDIDSTIFEDKRFIFKLLIASVYCFCLSRMKPENKYEPYEVTAMFDHIPYIPCACSYDIFCFFLQQKIDMFLLLEILTLQTEYVLDNVEVVEVDKYKTLNQKIIAAVREFKDYHTCMELEVLEEIQSIFKVFDGNTISYVDFTKISTMITKYKCDIDVYLKVLLPNLLQRLNNNGVLLLKKVNVIINNHHVFNMSLS